MLSKAPKITVNHFRLNILLHDSDINKVPQPARCSADRFCVGVFSLSGRTASCTIAQRWSNFLTTALSVLLIFFAIQKAQAQYLLAFLLSSDTYEAVASPKSYISPDLQAQIVLQKGLEQSTEHNAFHLFSHGRSGELFIEGEWLNAPKIAQWLRSHQVPDQKEHLNIYGCNFAQGEKGRAAVTYLEAILGISVSASDDVTGVDGDWELEFGNQINPICFNDYAYNLNENGRNVALSGTATASSFTNGNYAPAKAIDGNTEGVNSSPFFWASNGADTNPFILIDLEGCYNITCINIWNRTDCCSDRIVGAILEVLDENDVVQQSVTINSASTKIVANWTVTGNKVRLRKPNATSPLNIAEIEVFTSNPPLPTTATASSQLSAAYPPSKAIDGDTDGTNPNFWHSVANDTDPYLLLDLGASYDLDYVNIWNRTDCCGGRLDGAIVEVLDASDLVQFTYTIGTATTENTIFLNTIGQKVRIRKTGTATMNIAEVEVFEKQREIVAFAIQPSCDNNVAQSDGYLQISSVDNRDRYAFSTGSIFTGDPDYADAIDISSAAFPIQFNTGLSNADVGDFTIRFFNGEDGCFKDVVVNLKTQDCIIGCECEEVIYLNELSNGGKVHKYTIEDNGSFTEILNSGNSWYPGANTSELPLPHGIGMDLNGFLYIAENYWTGEIRKLTCDGDIFPESEFLIDGEPRFTNIQTIGNTIFTNRGNAYDLCTGNLINSVDLCDAEVSGSVAGELWGFYYDENTGYFYSTNNNDNGSRVYRYTLADYGSGVCVPNFIDVNNLPGIPSGGLPRGITTDPDGNIYMVHLASGTHVIKFDANGNYITHITDSGDGDGGFNEAIGIIHSETSDLLYVSTISLSEDCVSAINTDLTTVIAVVGPEGDSGQGQTGFNQGKAIGIIKECCPTKNNVNIDTSLCTASLNDVLFLQDLINCTGTICEGLWQAGNSNSGLIYNDCDNSITIDALNACGTFTLASDGTGNNPQCGAFKITVNIQVGSTPEAKVFAIQPSCTNDVPNNDGYLQISEITSGTRFNWSVGSTYTGDPDFLDAIDATGLTFPHIFNTGLSNPTNSQDYTIRIFADATACGEGCGYVDYMVTMNEQDCTVGCECEEYIYLNEPSGAGSIHKYAVNPDGSLAEIGAPWYDFAGTAEDPAAPHGLGVDLNGYLYIGESGNLNREIRKFNCDGEIFPESGSPEAWAFTNGCLLYTSPSPRDLSTSRMPSSA